MNPLKIQSLITNTLKKSGVSKKEKLLVALSGGKDSAVTAYMLSKLGYNIEGLHLNLHIGKYSEKCLEAVEELCNSLGINLHIYDIKKEMGSGICYLRTAVQNSNKGKGLKNCAICGVLKKWILNKKARELKASKIATGHNLDDESQTFLMNVFKGSPELSGNVGVVSRNVKDKNFIPRVKPLFYVPEDSVRVFSKKMKLLVVYEKCPCAFDSYRIQMRGFLENFSDKEKLNIVKSFENLDGKIQGLRSSVGVKVCSVCGEPARGEICKKCGLMEDVS